MTPDVLAEIFRQSAFISALIAGFSFAFLAVILTSRSPRRVDAWTAAFAVAATAGLTVCALGWTFSVPKVMSLPTADSPGASFVLPGELRTIHRLLSLLFIACFFSFLTSLGLSGWIRSRVLGIVSTTIAALAALFTLWMLRFFVS